jgi:hypothetical protein
MQITRRGSNVFGGYRVLKAVAAAAWKSVGVHVAAFSAGDQRDDHEADYSASASEQTQQYEVRPFQQKDGHDAKQSTAGNPGQCVCLILIIMVIFRCLKPFKVYSDTGMEGFMQQHTCFTVTSGLYQVANWSNIPIHRLPSPVRTY